ADQFLEIVGRHCGKMGLDLRPGHLLGFFQSDGRRALGQFGLVILDGIGLLALPLLVERARRAGELLGIRIGMERGFAVGRERPDALILDHPAGLDRRYRAETHDLLEPAATGFVLSGFVFGHGDSAGKSSQGVYRPHALRLSAKDMKKLSNQLARAALGDLGHACVSPWHATLSALPKSLNKQADTSMRA